MIIVVIEKPIKELTSKGGIVCNTTYISLLGFYCSQLIKHDPKQTQAPVGKEYFVGRGFVLLQAKRLITSACALRDIV